MKQPDRRRSKAFTLVEVLVALAIAAIALSSVAAAISQMAGAASAMQQRTYANWIAENQIAKMRLANTQPDVGESSGEETFAGLEWAWRATISETGVEHLYRVDVAVSLGDSDDTIRTVSGFIGEPGVPGLGNNSWTIVVPEQGAGI